MTHAPETRRRRTFAIISHPDAGKTTLTEKLLLFSGAIQIAGSVKARKASRHATSDEKKLGIHAVCVAVFLVFAHVAMIAGMTDPTLFGYEGSSAHAVPPESATQGAHMHSHDQRP